jgi:hypothetical protein
MVGLTLILRFLAAVGLQTHNSTPNEQLVPVHKVKVESSLNVQQ